MTANWYVSYAETGKNVMTIAKNRDEAITLACWMLTRGADVQEVGPMLELRDGNLLNAQDIREIQAQRLQAYAQSPV